MLGFLIVLLAAVFFCIHNVIVRVLFSESTVFGLVQTGGFVAPTLHNSFLLLVMRMAIVVALMASLANQMHKSTWQDLAQLRQSDQRGLLGRSLSCGALMFLYLALLYVSIGLIPAGIALTLFFTYPVFTSLFAWKWFGDRPTRLRWAVMGLVLLGSYLTVPQSGAPLSANLIGITTGVASGVAYALYTVLAQKSVETLHPVPFTWLSFATTLGLSVLSLLIWRGEDAQLLWVPLWIGSFFSAVFTFVGHLLTNIGIRLVGASSASLIGSTNPALTVVLAWVAIQEALTPLQLTGVVLVTLSVALLSREHR